MKYIFQHTAIIEHEIEASNVTEAKEKLFEDVLEGEGFFQKASNIVTDERIKIQNIKGDLIDTFNIYDM
jgi:hypothetical protein